MNEPMYYLNCYGHHWLYKNTVIEVNNQPITNETDLLNLPIIKTGTITEINLTINEVGENDYKFLAIRATGTHHFKVNPKYKCTWLDGDYSTAGYYDQFTNTFKIRMKKIKISGEDESTYYPFPIAPANYFKTSRKLYNLKHVLDGKYLPDKVKIEKTVEFETEEEIFPEEIYLRIISKREDYTITIFECSEEERQYYKSLDKKTAVFNNYYVTVDSSCNLRNSFLTKTNVTLKLIGQNTYCGGYPNQFKECIGHIRYTNSYNTENVNMLQFWTTHQDKNNIKEVISENNYHSLKLISGNEKFVKISSKGLEITGNAPSEGYLALQMYNKQKFELKDNILIKCNLEDIIQFTTLIDIQGGYINVMPLKSSLNLIITQSNKSETIRINKGILYIGIILNNTTQKIKYLIYDQVKFYQSQEYEKPAGDKFHHIMKPREIKSPVYFIYMAIMTEITQDMIKILDTSYYH